jgi:HEAT repeat protein
MGKVTKEDIAKWEAKRKVKPLLEAIDPKDDFISTKAINALAAIGDPATAPILLRHMASGIYLGMPAEVILKIGGFSGPETIPIYIEMLANTRHLLDRPAATVLDKLGAPTVEPLIGAVSSKDRNTRQWATQLLGTRRDPRAVEPLIAALTDNDGNVRGAAAGSLAQIGDQRAVEPLRTQLAKEGQHSYAERRIREALESLEKGVAPPDTAQGGTVKVTLKIPGAVHGSNAYIGEYTANLPLDVDGPQLLNSIAKNIIWKDQVRFYTGYALVCLREAGVQVGDVLEFVDWGGNFL